MGKNKYELKGTTLDQLLDYMSSSMNRGRINPSGKEFSCACPFCGDSKSDPFATSFYVNIDPSSDRFLNYHCFRASCGTSGIVNSDFLEMIGFDRRDCIKDIQSFLSNNTVNVNGKYIAKKSKTLYNIINTKNIVSEKKLNYINSRLGLHLSYEDIYKLKVNLDLNSLLEFNDVNIPKDKIYKYNKLSNYGISFISAYSDYVIVRDVSKSGKIGKRYTNVNIFDNYENVTKAYCIPGSLDLLDPSPCVINIAEGVFDIIGIYHNLNIDKKYKNKIYLAACGSGLVSILKSYIQQYGILNPKINIFSDSDVGIDNYKGLYKLKPYLKSFDVTIHYNDFPGEKDFGVPKNKIKLIKTKL